MILNLYFARRFLFTFLGVFAVFLGILLLIDMVEQIRRTTGRDIGIAAAAHLSALNVPTGLYAILPLVVILAAITMFLSLARSSELVVTRAAGVSALRSLLAPVISALLLGVLAVGVFNPIVAATSKRYEELSGRYFRNAESVLSVSQDGLWLRQGGAEGQWVIRAIRSNPDGTHLFDVSFIGFDLSGRPARRLEAAEATLTPGMWVLTQATEWPLNSENPQRDVVLHDSVTLASNLTRDEIRNSFAAPSSIPIWELPAFIRKLEAAGFSARLHRVWFHMELALPMFLAAMVLIAAGFTMRHFRAGKTGTMVLFALLSGLVVFFLRNFAQVLGENGQIPVLIAAWSPPVGAVLLSLGFLLHLEDG